MSRYATLDPNLISSTSDKRKAPSLVALQLPRRKELPKEFLLR
jgi:hypothetical protein